MENKENEFEWIIKIINSCNKLDQIEVTDNLIMLFYKKYDDNLMMKALVRINENMRFKLLLN